jgi:hypothetical protein
VGSLNIHKHGAVKVPKHTKGPKSGKVETTKINPRVMKKALQIVNGDATRLRINKDGTVDIKN